MLQRNLKQHFNSEYEKSEQIEFTCSRTLEKWKNLEKQSELSIFDCYYIILEHFEDSGTDSD